MLAPAKLAAAVVHHTPPTMSAREMRSGLRSSAQARAAEITMREIRIDQAVREVVVKCFSGSHAVARAYVANCGPQAIVDRVREVWRGAAGLC